MIYLYNYGHNYVREVAVKEVDVYRPVLVLCMSYDSADPKCKTEISHHSVASYFKFKQYKCGNI
jgi:hypothetical protein